MRRRNLEVGKRLGIMGLATVGLEGAIVSRRMRASSSVMKGKSGWSHSSSRDFKTERASE